MGVENLVDHKSPRKENTEFPQSILEKSPIVVK
jgi:hypothetical protein